MRASVITRHGGPEVLKLRDEPEPEPGDGELLVALEAAGINFRDVYERAGRGYAGNSKPPLIGGVEGAGTVLRSNSPEFEEGDRVGWAAAPYSYAERVVVSAAAAVPLPGPCSGE